MKIYFCGSIRAGRQDAELYARLINQLRAYGTVLTEHVGSKELEESEKTRTDKYIHDRDVDWLVESDAVVAEVTQPSLGVGYEIGRAVAMNKKILCLFRPSPDKRLSAMIAGADNGSTFIVKNYQETDASDIFKNFFS
ncbi:putative 2'-deoxynucleoside 5'-phosphate N-hydrolase 1 [Ruditapes philippinarum]|uniref:putative 2'-deoxynucleoside 5'-phosphate N-hydrolase 1 n=1 Tax=Ruditapes philippinarum TaxID=129788 RepID=UPI00295AC32C|nr:putative 2'-deoxynucleoside 5'-phosphate N-hydrolase 1 [Ruditapes philippinarum]XP_060607825.1 putative 2'-deoxynucleoside 5'-phosphate N-hydrolase 1 [Ruditapes philippinarum]